MKKAVVAILVIVALVGGVLFGLQYMRGEFEQYRDGAKEKLATLDVARCKMELAGQGEEEIRLLYMLSGVPEASMDDAIDMGLERNCECFVKAAGGADLEAFFADAENHAALERCASESAEAVLGEFAETSEEP